MSILLVLTLALAQGGDVIRNFRDYWDVDPRAGLADLCGVTVLTPDQERAVEVLHREPTVGLMGGVNTGKSWLLGKLALLYVGCHGNCKAIFSGPKEEQTALLAWAHLQAAYRFANDKAAGLQLPRAFGGRMNRYDWQCGDDWPDWWARVYACQRGTDGSTMRGMLHAPSALACLEEVNSMDESGVNALWTGTRAPGALFWFSFNPTSRDDTAGRLWAQLSPARQVQLSLLRLVEWQDRTGVTLPGCTDRATLERDFRKFEGTPLWYTNVLGEFPPESAEWVVLPKPWFDACRGDWQPTPADLAHVGIGVDTAGGRAENVIAVAAGRFVRVEWASRELHQTPHLVTAVKGVANRYGSRAVPIAVDVVGQGGKGVADDLRADGYNALDFVGGGREFAGRKDELSADVVTWAWWTLREAARVTVEGGAGLVLPDDSVLREQLARQYHVVADRRYKLADKGTLDVSPDRADACAMAWLAANGLGVVRLDQVFMGA